MWLYGKDGSFAHEGSYLWHVDVSTSSAGGYRGYYYLIDADSGRIVGNDRDSDFSGAP
jgi:hypothetical protein